MTCSRVGVGRRGVAADRQRPPSPPAAGRPRRARRECAPSAPTTTPGRQRRRRRPRRRSGVDRAHPVPDAARRRRPGAASTSRASKTARGIDPGRPGHLAGRRRDAPAPAAAGAPAPSRRARRSTPTSASRSSTCGAMPSPQDLSRGKSARSSSSTRSDGSARSAPRAAAAPAGPAPRRQVPGRRHRGATSSRHVDQGDAHRGPERQPSAAGERPPATSADDDEQADPGASAGAGPGGPSTASDASRPASGRWRRRASRPAPSRCGSPRTPVAASSSRSGSALSEVRADPEQRAGADHPRRRASRGRVAGQASTTAGSEPNATAYGQPRPRRRLEPEVVGPAGRRRDQVDERRRASRRASDSGDGRDDGRDAQRAGRHAARRRRWPAACRCGAPRGRGRRRAGRWTSRSTAGR